MEIDGEVVRGWEPVADAFQRNFTDGNELGAAVAVYHGAQCVVDIWGGVADARVDAPWRQETVVPVFSSTKGATAICAHMLVERGELDLDAPVARYWPEFAQAGKAEVPVRWLLSHQVGLPYVDADLSFDDLAAERPVLDALAAQEPHWSPGSHFAYHAVTFGHLVGEVIRRVTGTGLREFFEREIATPLGLQSWIGLPTEAVVDLAFVERESHEIDQSIQALFGPESVFGRSISLGHALPFELVNGGPRDFNDRETLAITLGGSSMVSDARSLARLYAATLTDVDDVRLLSEGSLRAAGQVQTTDVPYFGWPSALGNAHPFNFSLGFMAHPVSPALVGHGGAGGSLGAAHPDAKIGFGYVMNRMDASAPDTRAASLLEQVLSCAEQLEH